MNRAFLLGNIGQDPELRYTGSGTAVLNIRMATSERYKDRQSDEWKESTEWHSVTVWDKRAEALSKFLRKGSKILVEGTIQTRSYEGRDGTKRYSTEIKARDIVLLDKREDGERQERPTNYGPVDGHPSAGHGDNWDD